MWHQNNKHKTYIITGCRVNGEQECLGVSFGVEGDAERGDSNGGNTLAQVFTTAPKTVYSLAVSILFVKW